MKFEVHQKHGFEPDETIPERIIRLADAESEEGAFRVDPPCAHSHRIPTNLRVSTIQRSTFTSTDQISGFGEYWGEN